MKPICGVALHMLQVCGCERNDLTGHAALASRYISKAAGQVRKSCRSKWMVTATLEELQMKSILMKVLHKQENQQY